MSNREYAVELITSLTDEQVDNLVNFIVSFSNVTVNEGKNDDLQSKRRSFERIKEIRNSAAEETGRDYKEMYLEYLDERYGI
ncbi:MAG: hypothetical protein K2N72_00935 [Oscillospiraceae bacterium]|nr:hypothetical protein [Oscillospiraceae bacterium]